MSASTVLSILAVRPQEMVKVKLRAKFKNSRFKQQKTNRQLSGERERKSIRAPRSRAADIGLLHYGPPEFERGPEARKVGYELLAAGDSVSSDEKHRMKTAEV